MRGGSRVAARSARALGLAFVVTAVAALTLPIWKPAAKRIRWVVIASNVCNDALRRVGVRSDQIGQPDYAGLPLAEIPAYIARVNRTVAGYEKYGGLSPAVLRGKQVLEVGQEKRLASRSG